ncbi:MAG: hypothetical protein C5B50_09335 [Verrucomicrobia bacterium]|nr:MAG: hypothetical protein C5B50_09335 [Verrucomicrobiota bacterium]
MNAKQTMRYFVPSQTGAGRLARAGQAITRAALLLALLCPLATQAVGYRLPNQDPDAIARGNAFVATADNPSAIYYNPAGITQLDGQQARAGLYLVSGGYTYDAPNGKEYKADSAYQPVPQLYYVISPKELPLSFGLGVYAPYGLSLDWGRNTSFNTIAEKGKLEYISINPVVAWKALPTLSFAIGPTINYSKAKFERAIGLLPSPPFPAEGGHFSVEGDGWGYGLNAGVRWQPSETLAFGINYRLATDVDYDGSSSTTPSPPLPASVSTTASIHFPQFIVGGISYRPSDNWNLEFNLDWTDWDSVNSIPINHTAFGNTALALNYHSSFMYEFGATRQLGRGYFASIGYFYSENSSPDKYFNPIIPDTDLHLGSLGGGYRGTRWGWSAAWHFGYNPGRTVEGSPVSMTGQTADGRYHVFNNGFNVAVTLKF